MGGVGRSRSIRLNKKMTRPDHHFGGPLWRGPISLDSLQEEVDPTGSSLRRATTSASPYRVISVAKVSRSSQLIRSLNGIERTSVILSRRLSSAHADNDPTLPISSSHASANSHKLFWAPGGIFDSTMLLFQNFSSMSLTQWVSYAADWIKFLSNVGDKCECIWVNLNIVYVIRMSSDVTWQTDWIGRRIDLQKWFWIELKFHVTPDLCTNLIATGHVTFASPQPHHNTHIMHPTAYEHNFYIRWKMFGRAGNGFRTLWYVNRDRKE